MNFKINGVEVEFDFFDMDEKEDFDAIFLTANEKIQKLSNEHKDFDTKFGKAYCEVIGSKIYLVKKKLMKFSKEKQI